MFVYVYGVLQSLFRLRCDIGVGRPSQCVISLNQAPKYTQFNPSLAVFSVAPAEQGFLAERLSVKYTQRPGHASQPYGWSL